LSPRSFLYITKKAGLIADAGFSSNLTL